MHNYKIPEMFFVCNYVVHDLTLCSRGYYLTIAEHHIYREMTELYYIIIIHCL